MIAADFLCENHAGVRSAAFCAVCMKPLCGDCVVTLAAREGPYCEDSHRTFAQYHVLLAEVPSSFEADALIVNLTLQGVDAVRFAFRDHAAVVLANAEDAARIFVQLERATEAREILDRLHLLDEPTL